MNSKEIEIALTTEWYSKFNTRRYFVIPNAWWGINLDHEADLLAISGSGYAHEIEIKVSVSDMRADLKKYKHKTIYKSKTIRAFWYAMPVSIYEKCIEIIPEIAGIITIDDNTHRNTVVRKPKINTLSAKLSTNNMLKLGNLMAMRYWNLKKVVIDGE